MRKIPVIGFVLMLLVGTSAVSAWQSDPVGNGSYQFERLTNDLLRPVYMTHAGDERLFLVEKSGRIRIMADGVLLESPFLDIVDKVGSGGNEQGLLSIAFPPDYAESGVFYVYYTDQGDDTVVERYQVTDDPNVADPASAELIFTARQPYENHNGGLVKFGPDGYLYIGLGDGGAGGDPQGNGQDLSEPLGSILRVDVSDDAPYTIPADNPFIDTADALPEIWSYGLRNPWRFSFDRATGDLYIADVGQGDWEEIHFQPADSPGGENYGWNYYEADHAYLNADEVDASTLVFPILEYSHANGNCSITGGYVYRGEALPELQGKYFYGDWCSGTIWTLERSGEAWVSSEFLDTDFSISSFAEDVNGELYMTVYPNELWKLTGVE